MNGALAWLQAAPAGALTLITGIIGAIVAIVVAILTQWILGRRARTELLTTKLEELYLLLNQIASENVGRYEKLVVHLYRVGQSSPLPIDRSAYSLDAHKKIIMYVELYFPRLRPAHVRMFHANSEVTQLLHRASTGERPSEEEIREAFGSYSECLRNMEDEVIQNRATLVRDIYVPRRHKVSSLHSPPPG